MRAMVRVLPTPDRLVVDSDVLVNVIRAVWHVADYCNETLTVSDAKRASDTALGIGNANVSASRLHVSSVESARCKRAKFKTMYSGVSAVMPHRRPWR